MMMYGDDKGDMTPEQREFKEQRDQVQRHILALRDEWVRHRAACGVEDRWRRAEKLYEGDQNQDDHSLVETLRSGAAPRSRKAQDQARRSRVVVNIVRPKVDQATARVCEILLPTDDKNWGIRPTPVPQTVESMVGDTRVTVMPDGVTPNPEGLTADMEAREFIKQAKRAAADMERAIDDSLNECDYNGEQRRVIADGVRLGTGVLLGPFPMKQTARVWRVTEAGSELVESVSIVPASASASPWDIWFDPSCGRDHQNGAGFWHRRMVTRKQIRALVGVPGYDPDALRKVLAEGPTRVKVADGRAIRTSTGAEQAYELWTYHGEIEPEQASLLSSTMEGDPLTIDFGVAMFINACCVGMTESWVADKSLPVDTWCWREDPNSPWGHPLALELEHQQRVVTASWRQVMDNASYSVGSQLVMLDGVRPADGSPVIYGGKMWVASPDKVSDVRAAMGAVDIPSHLGELLTIAKTAMEMADSETSMPQILGGQQGSAPETVGGTVMLFNNAQAVLRLRVKLYDDGITRPHIRRYYDWNMANNPDQRIKGDMEVDARGASALLERDIQNQATLNLAAVTSNPRYQLYLDPKEELKTLLRAFKQDPDALMASDDEIKRRMEQPQPQDPRIAAAQLQAELKGAELADRKEQRQHDAKRDAAADAMRREDLEYQRAREQGEFEIAMTQERNERDLELAKMAQERGLTIEALQAQMGVKVLEINNKRELFNAEAALKQAHGTGI